jgi:thiol-disulfide isomerase/thioredoxin
MSGFDLFEEYSDNSKNSFTLESSQLVGGAPAEQPQTGDKHLPNVDLYDPVADADDFHKFLDGQLKDDADGKPKLKDKYDTKNVDEAVEASIKNNVPMVVHIGAPWCGPCLKMEKEVWPGVEKDLKGKAAFVHLDGDAIMNEKVGGKNAEKLVKGVESFPTIRVVQPSRDKDGNVTFKTLSENVGGMDDARVRDMMTKAKIVKSKN